MKLTRLEIMELNHVLSTTNYEMPIRPQYRYMVTQNIKLTKQEIDAVNEAFPMPLGIDEYRNKRMQIQTKYNVSSDIDLANLPEDDAKKYWADVSALDVEYSVLLEEIKVYEVERNEFLKESVDLPLRTVKIDDCPVIAPSNQYNHWDIWAVIEKVVEG